MSNTDASRVEIKEEGSTFVSPRLSDLIKEIDGRVNGANIFVKFIRTGGLISRTEWHRNDTFSDLAFSRDFTRVSGSLGTLLVSGIVSKFYEEDGITLDSTVSAFLARDLTVSGSDYITFCSGYFSTSESEC